MKAYKNIKFVEFPDIADIQNQGRKSSVGRVNSEHGYTRNSDSKKAIRRYMKHRDRAIENRFNALAEGN